MTLGGSLWTQQGRPGDPATRRPGDPATRRPGDPATRRPGDPATRRPGDPATRRPGDPATRRPGRIDFNQTKKRAQQAAKRKRTHHHPPSAQEAFDDRPIDKSGPPRNQNRSRDAAQPVRPPGWNAVTPAAGSGPSRQPWKTPPNRPDAMQVAARRRALSRTRLRINLTWAAAVTFGTAIVLTADPAPCSRTGSAKKRSPQNSPQTRPGLYSAVPLTSKRPSETNPRPNLPPLSVSPAFLQEALPYNRTPADRSVRLYNLSIVQDTNTQ